MDQIEIMKLAQQIRSNQKNGNVFSVSTSVLSSVLSALKLIDMSTSASFRLNQISTMKIELSRDLHFLQKFFKQTKALKVYEDNPQEEDIRNLTEFSNLISVEFFKVDLNKVKGLQSLRAQLQKLVCHQTLNRLGDVLANCGGDESDGYCWNELKELVFTKNEMLHLDPSLEYVPWLHTLDLSYNHITDIKILDILPNLKHLNLSFNKLEGVPKFQGQICSRLQNLILKNNFIEDISGLQTLTSIFVLDLSTNCLVDSKSLMATSHLATLQWLNLNNNPLNLHPHHRTKAASYLHSNTASTHFVLNCVPLSYPEKKLVGTLYPAQSKNFSNISSDAKTLSSEKICKVRDVIIEEQIATTVSVPTVEVSKPQPYLETKKQIENLREQYGESWLNSQSALMLQGVLGLEESVPVASSPYEADFTLHSDIVYQSSLKAHGSPNKTDSSFLTALDSTLPESKDNTNNEVYSRQSTSESMENTEEESTWSDDDLELEGEENIHLATVPNEADPIFVVLTQKYIAEKECDTGKERVRWHIRSVVSCVELESSPDTVQINFETMRKDRQKRIYVFDPDDLEQFVACVRSRIVERSPKKDNRITYQCMKCSLNWCRAKNKSAHDEPTVKCPSCDSTLVIEV